MGIPVWEVAATLFGAVLGALPTPTFVYLIIELSRSGMNAKVIGASTVTLAAFGVEGLLVKEMASYLLENGLGQWLLIGFGLAFLLPIAFAVYRIRK